ncbi:MAG: TetR family transcriptional regulator [Solirubrobacterales bacterium]
MSPGTAARSRGRLIEAAKAAFREHGFHRASADAVAADAGFTRGALHASFDGKEGLFLAVLDEEIDARWATLSQPADAETAAARCCRLLDQDPGWTLALLEFTIHAARHPELAEQLRGRNDALRRQAVDVIAALRPELSRGNVEVGVKLALAVNTGIALVEAVCSHQGAEGDGLYKRIENLGQKITLPKGMIDSLHNLRLLGNDAAHVESRDYEEIGQAEVDTAIKVTKLILEATYQMQSILGELEALKREPASDRSGNPALSTKAIPLRKFEPRFPD